LRPNETETNRDSEAAARASLVRYGRTRLFLSRLFENLLIPILHLSDKDDYKAAGESLTILVVEYWNLGDFVMITPFLKNLRLHFPKAHIVLLASPRTIPLAEGQGFIDEVIPVTVPWVPHMSRWKKYFSRDWIGLFQCVRMLRKRRFDLGFTARADVRENFIMWAGGIKRRVGYGFAYGGKLLTDIVPPDLSRSHYSERWLHLLEHLNKPILDRRPELRLRTEHRELARRRLAEMGIENGDVLVGIHAGARNEVRQWGNQRFLEVAKRLRTKFPVKIVWFQDASAEQTPTVEGLIPLRLPLQEFLAILAECRVLVCNDTGPMHMASGLSVPVVAVFGPTQPEWFGPIGEDHKIVIRREMWCRPCFDYCVFDQPYCLRLVSVDSVYEAVAEALRVIFGAAGLGNKAMEGSPELFKIISRADSRHD
jgi:ADP-heptose:LPS heptosyltransferase